MWDFADSSQVKDEIGWMEFCGCLVPFVVLWVVVIVSLCGALVWGLFELL